MTADALVIEVAHNAGDRVFLVCQNRAAVEASRVNTMMTCRCDCLLEGSPPIVAHKLTDIAPSFAVIEAVERVTRGDARFAAAAFIEIHLESELLARCGRGERNQVAVARRGNLMTVVSARELLDRGKLTLFSKQVVNQRASFIEARMRLKVRRGHFARNGWPFERIHRQRLKPPLLLR